MTKYCVDKFSRVMEDCEVVWVKHSFSSQLNMKCVPYCTRAWIILTSLELMHSHTLPCINPQREYVIIFLHN